MAERWCSTKAEGSSSSSRWRISRSSSRTGAKGTDRETKCLPQPEAASPVVQPACFTLRGDSKTECGTDYSSPPPANGRSQDSNACRFREGFLLLIECQDRAGSHFDGDGDMEKIHPADGKRKAVSGTDVIRGANGVPRVEFDVRLGWLSMRH